MADKLWVGTDSGNEGDLGVAANWDPVGVPGPGDTVWFLDSSQDVTAGLDVWAGSAAPDAIHFCRSYTGRVGDGDEYLEVGETVITVGEHFGSGAPLGSGRLRIDMGAHASSLLVLATAYTATDAWRRPLEVLADHAAAVIEVRSGQVAVADRPGESGELAELRLAPPPAGLTEPDVVSGDELVLASAEAASGALALRGAVTAIVQSAGQCRTSGAGAVASWIITGGSAYPESSGTLSLLEARGGQVDFLGSREPRTVSALKLYRGAQVAVDTDVVTITALTLEESARVLAS